VARRCWSRTRPGTWGRGSWESEWSRTVDGKSGAEQRYTNRLWA